MSLADDRPYQSYPPSLWTPPPPPPAATGATAGTPGSWTPDGSTPPATAPGAEVTASPATAWPAGSYVDAGDGSDWHWDGTAWVAGAAPVIEDPEPEVEAEAPKARRRRSSG